MNSAQKTITSALKELGAELCISEAGMRAVVRKRITHIKAAHEAKN